MRETLGTGSCVASTVAGSRKGLENPGLTLRAVCNIWGGEEGVQPGHTTAGPVPMACGRGVMTPSLFTVSPSVWELITVRTRRDGWKDEQITVCL